MIDSGLIISFLKTFAPVSIASNLIIGILLLVISISLLSVKQKTKGKIIGGRICLVMSGLALIGSASTWFVSTFVF